MRKRDAISGILRIIAPAVAGHFVLSRCPPEDMVIDPYINAIGSMMWPIILIFMGYAWQLTRANAPSKMGMTVDFAYLAGVTSLCGWFYYHFCLHDATKAALLKLTSAITGAALVYFSGRISAKASILLIPYLIWLLLIERWKIPKIHLKLPTIKLSLPSLEITK